MEVVKYFKGSIIFTLVALVLGYLWAHHASSGFELQAMFIICVLSVLEVSLSFDNAVVNAAKLEKMSPLWQHRFLTWGMFIAVFGMRFFFPLAVVAIFAKLGIVDVLNMALNNPDKYAHYLHLSHPPVLAFGGSFLIMLFFNYFLNPNKEIHWFKALEKKLSQLGHVEGLSVILTLLILALATNLLNPEIKLDVISAGIWGIIIYLLVDGVSKALEKKAVKVDTTGECTPHFSLTNHCFINFLYLELIDASFSLDGTLGAFALSKDILIITIGLSIGAMFVRSLTIMFVEKKTLKEFIYLESGAHWAIGALASIMFLSLVYEVNEVVTGLIGLVFIISAFISSLKKNKEA